MRYVHIKSIEKYHPGYKDRDLRWAKIHFNMVQGDPDCEMIKDEIDHDRLIRFIILELQAKRPIPIDPDYLTKKGFNLKKRSIELTLNVLHNFIEIVDDFSKVCGLEESRVEESREEKRDVCEELLQKWNAFTNVNTKLSSVLKITPERRVKINKRAGLADKFDDILRNILEQPFLMGENDRGWTVTFDWLIENDTNYIKILEKRYVNNSSKSAADEVFEKMGFKNANTNRR